MSELVGHVGQEFRLVLTCFELRVHAELVVHPIDVGCQRSQFVAVLDVVDALEVSRRDRRESAVDILDRTDERLRRMNPSNSASTSAAPATPMNSACELNELAFRAISSTRPASRPPVRGERLEVAREFLHLTRIGSTSSAVASSCRGDELLVQHHPKTVGSVPDGLEVP